MADHKNDQKTIPMIDAGCIHPSWFWNRPVEHRAGKESILIRAVQNIFQVQRIFVP